MGKNKKPGNRNNQNNQGNSKPAKKPSFFSKLVGLPKTVARKHPKIAKGVRITTQVVEAGLAAIGGAGLIAVFRERAKEGGSKPELPVASDIPIVSDPDILSVKPEE